MPRDTGRLLTRAALSFVTLLVVAYLGTIGYIRFNERAFIYLPGERGVPTPAAGFALNEERVTYPSTDNVALSAWIVPAGGPNPSDMWMLMCHGNFGSIGYGQRPEFYAFMRDIGVNLLAFDYRGYGDSTGTPTERGLYEDATASYDFLIRTRRIPPERIVLFGHSLGSAVAIELASRVQVAALVMDGAFTSVVDRAQEIYPLLPIRFIATEHFPSLDRIRTIRIPKLFLHSPDDSVIPYAHGRRLFDAAPPPKRLVEVKGGHEYAYRQDKAIFYGAIAQLIETVTPQASSPGLVAPAGPTTQ